MGIGSRLRSVGGTVFNFRVGRWLGYDSIANSFSQVKDIFLGTVTIQHAQTKESFEDALTRLNLTEQDLNDRTREFNRLFIMYLAISTIIFCYSLAIVYYYGNILGFFMGFALTVFSLSNAFRFHFWLYQIRTKRLGCSVRDWLLDK